VIRLAFLYFVLLCFTLLYFALLCFVVLFFVRSRLSVGKRAWGAGPVGESQGFLVTDRIIGQRAEDGVVSGVLSPYVQLQFRGGIQN